MLTGSGLLREEERIAFHEFNQLSHLGSRTVDSQISSFAISIRVSPWENIFSPERRCLVHNSLAATLKMIHQVTGERLSVTS